MASRSHRVFGVLAATTFLMVAALVGGAIVSHSPHNLLGSPLSASAASGLNFDNLVFIVMENHNICDILASCGGTATYMSSLADSWGLAANDHYCNVNPSLPNYLCLLGGTDFGCSGYDGDPHSNACTNTAWNSANLVDRLEAGGVTWKAYMQDMPSNCYGSNSGDYAVRHNPFVYFNSVVSNPDRCARVVPSGSSDSTFLNDLASPSTTSNFMWLDRKSVV